MRDKQIVLSIFILIAAFRNSAELRFTRRIEAVGAPYYKILMYIGHCRGDVLYYDQKIWGKIRMNRVLDIYYRSSDPTYKVSRVEIRLIINSTNTIAFSEDGIGQSEFSGSLYLPLNISLVIYQITIYTCVRKQLNYFENRPPKIEKYLRFITTPATDINNVDETN